MKKLRSAAIFLLVLLTVYGALSWFQTGSRPDKIGLHRCNSLEKLQEVGGDYSLIEVDVCIRPEGILDVTHDEDTTFGLALPSYFPYLHERPECRMWIDVKNLDNSNFKAFFTMLDSLCARYAIRHERLIVESRNWEFLPPPMQKNYVTSYYVDAPKPSTLSAHQIDSVITHLDAVIATGKVDAISFPGWWYVRLRRQFRHRDISFLIWRHRTTEWELFLDPIGRLMLADSRVKTVLVKNKGKYHR